VSTIGAALTSGSSEDGANSGVGSAGHVEFGTRVNDASALRVYAERHGLELDREPTFPKVVRPIRLEEVLNHLDRRRTPRELRLTFAPLRLLVFLLDFPVGFAFFGFREDFAFFRGSSC
jgi:hypothetical protein